MVGQCIKLAIAFIMFVYLVVIQIDKDETKWNGIKLTICSLYIFIMVWNKKNSSVSYISKFEWRLIEVLNGNDVNWNVFHHVLFYSIPF